MRAALTAVGAVSHAMLVTDKQTRIRLVAQQAGHHVYLQEAKKTIRLQFFAQADKQRTIIDNPAKQKLIAMSLIAANANAVLGARSAGTHRLLPRRQGIVGSFNGTDQIEVCDRGGAEPLPTQQVTPGSTVNVSFDVSEEFRGRTFNVSSV